MKNGEEEVERKKTRIEKTQSITTTLEASSLKNTAGVPFGIMPLVVGDRKKKFSKQEIGAGKGTRTRGLGKIVI